MSTTSTHETLFDSASFKPATERKGFFAKLIEARMRRGEAHVAAFLKRQSDRALADLGFSPDAIGSIRVTGKIPASHWR